MRTQTVTIGRTRDGEDNVGFWKNWVEYYSVCYPGLDGVCLDGDLPVVQFWYVRSGERHTEIHRYENAEQAHEHYDAIVRAMEGVSE